MKTIKCNNENIKKIVKSEIKKHGIDCSLNHLDTSCVSNMSQLFYLNDEFVGDISKWDVANVADMSYMFRKSKFNGDLGGWNTNSLRDISYMFDSSEFSQNLSHWDSNSIVKSTDAYFMSRSRDSSKIRI